ncbi:MAG: aminotransferase class III-fold pyridoxal phosphate-dependent enzyme [Polyangiaceae bacterium]
MTGALVLPQPVSPPEPTVDPRYRRSHALVQRAHRVIPGGGHLTGKPLGDPARTPMYMESGRGARVRDVDGNEYVDWVMAFGPFLLGYRHPEVDEAGCRQIEQGALLSMNHPVHIEYIEALVARLPGAEMGTFFRTGSEATTAARRIARRATGRRVVVRAGYHGWHDWCLPAEQFVPAGLESQVLEFRADDPASLQACFAARPQEIAAVIVAPEMVVPTRAEVFQDIARITRAGGAVLVFDEVKTALRIAPGTIQQRVDVRPDLTTMSKALGNGWPIAAVLGTRAVMEHAAGMHFSATYHGDTAAMKASLKALEVIDRDRAAEHVDRLGRRLIEGLNTIAQSHRVSAVAYGEPLPPMPFLRFEDADARSARLRDLFYEQVLARGVLLHPRHMWFVSLAHSAADVERTLEVCDAAMRHAAASF